MLFHFGYVCMTFRQEQTDVYVISKHEIDEMIRKINNKLDCIDVLASSNDALSMSLHDFCFFLKPENELNVHKAIFLSLFLTKVS